MLGKGMKGSLTVLGATPPKAAGISQPGTDNEMDFPPLTADSQVLTRDNSGVEMISDTVPIATMETVSDQPPRTRADKLNTEHSKCFLSQVPMLEHTLQVHPIFMNYKKVSSEGYKTPLIDVAVAVGKAIGDCNLDAVQPTHNGWQIYVKTKHDRVSLMASGLDLAGKHISLEARTTSMSIANVKITIKDLHEVTNEDVLTAVKQVASVSSPVKYANIWVDRCHTHLHNGDRFFYVPEDEVSKFGRSMMIQDMKARVFKPVIFSQYSRYNQQGH